MWSPSRLPAAGDVVRISANTTVTLDGQMPAPAQCVGIDGTLRASLAVPSRLWAGTVLVYRTGTLEMGTVAAPVPVGVTAEVVIADQPLDLAFDPDQYGTGLIVLGTVRLHGASRTPAWTRLAAEPRAGQSLLSLSQAGTGWRPGDRLVLPDTRHLTNAEGGGRWAPDAPQWEELTVQAVSADGRSVAVSPALAFDHLGARNAAGALELLPHVGNLTRNVVVRSDVAIGAAGTRGHAMFTDRATVDIRYAWFRDMGRTTIDPLDPATNHIGRYAVHMHHLMGPQATPANGYQFTFIGNAVDGGSGVHRLKWGMAVHNSHYGLIQGNVFYNWAGAAVMFEDGSESFNLLDSNFAVRSVGTGDRTAIGTEGGGFWFRGPNNYVRQNVAANLWGDQPEAAYGFKYFLRYLGIVNVPAFKGADTSVAGQFTPRDGNTLPLLEFSGNEVYGAAQGLTYWWVNSQDPAPNPTAAESLLRDTTIWHVYNKAIYNYPSAAITFDGLKIRGVPDASSCCSEGYFGGDYAAGNLTFRNVDIQGMWTGIELPTVTWGAVTIENSTFRNDDDIRTTTIYSVNGGSWIGPRSTIVRNSTFGAWPGRSHHAFSRTWDAAAHGDSNNNITQRDELLVYGYQNNPAVSFQVYYWEQASQNIAGGLAPCGNTHPDVDGIVCPIGYVPPAAGLPTAPLGLSSAVSNLSVSLTWAMPSTGPVSGFLLEVGSGPGLRDILQLPLPAAQLGLAAPAPPGRYYVRVRAGNQYGIGPASNEVVVVIAGSNEGPPPAPTGLRVSVSGTDVALAWDAPVGLVASDYLLEVGSAPGLTDISPGLAVGAATSFAAGGVPVGTYYVRVRARSGAAVSGPSNEQVISVAPVVVTPPGRPTGLSALVLAGRTLRLSWTPSTSGGAVTQYLLEAGTASGGSNLGVFPLPPTSAFTVANVPPGTYYLRVRAVNSGGTSAASSQIRVVVN